MSEGGGGLPGGEGRAADRGGGVCLCVGWGAAGVGEGSCVSAEVGVGGWLWRLAGCLRGEVREAGVEAGAVDEGKKIKLKIKLPPGLALGAPQPLGKVAAGGRIGG